MIEPAGMALVAFSFAASKCSLVADSPLSLWNRTKGDSTLSQSEPARKALRQRSCLRPLQRSQKY
jgi:hypothetical protein